MLGFILLVLAAVVLTRWLMRLKPTSTQKHGSPRLQQAEKYAARLFREKHYLPAEKAYLDVLKLDHRHADAYAHLGAIYSIQHNYPDAIESFVLAARYAPSATAYQHLGQVYLENKNTVKSVAAYEKSIMFEPSAARYAGLSKALERLGSNRKAVEAQEKAVELDDSDRYRGELAKLYAQYGRPEQAAQIQNTD